MGSLKPGAASTNRQFEKKVGGASRSRRQRRRSSPSSLTASGRVPRSWERGKGREGRNPLISLESSVSACVPLFMNLERFA
jgi:hypothetical protein